jgi:uncharacterized protein YndB with AHSA1/START domain
MMPPFEGQDHGNLDLSVTRLIDAPVTTVWRIATQRMDEYFCPKPWRAEVVEQDWRAGGRSALVMHGPDGEHMPQEGVFLEVTPPAGSATARFVFTDALAAGWKPQGPFMVGIMEFADEGGKTRYTGTARHWTPEAYQQHKTMGFEQGWGIVAEQLAALAEAEVQPA